MMTSKQILELKFHSRDLEREVTIREFFYELLSALYVQKEMFDAKRPWGNSDWDGDLIICLITNKLVSGTLDGDEEQIWIDEYDEDEVNQFVEQKILQPLFNIKS